MNEKTEQMKLPGRKQTQLNPAKTKRMILLVFVVLLIFIVIRGGFEIISLNKQEKQIEQELAAKKAEMEKLEKKREYMSSEAYIEQTARDMLKMIRPGEILYVMKENGEDKSNSDTKDKENSKDDGDKGEAGGED